MFQPAGIVVVFQQIGPVGATEGNVEFHLVFRLVLTVASPALRRPHLDIRQRIIADGFLHIVRNSVLVNKFLGFISAAVLGTQYKQQVRVDNRLPAHGIPKVFQRNADIGEHLQVGFPTNDGARVFLVIRLFFQAADVFPVFEMKRIAEAVAPDLHIHIF